MKFTLVIRTALVAALVPVFSQVMAVPAQAQTVATPETLMRIDIAGRQRMLTQRISKAACFLQNGINVEIHETMVQGSFALFATSHDALQFGNENLGLLPETTGSVLAAMAQVNTRWVEFFPYVLSIIEGGEVSAGDMEKLDANGLALLADMHQAVLSITHNYSEANSEVSLMATTMADIPGRQRMLSQKAAKLFCLVDSGIEVTQNMARLTETEALFTNTLNALINGMPGLVSPPPNALVHDKLLEVQAAWAAPKSVLDNVINGEEISDMDRQIIAVQWKTCCS